MHIVLFEPKNVERLYPVTLGRAAFDILCGGTTLYALLQRAFATTEITWRVRDYLTDVTKLRFPVAAPATGDCLYLSAALAPRIATIDLLKEIIAQKTETVLTAGGDIIGAYLRKPFAAAETADIAETLAALSVPATDISVPRLQNLWDVIFENEKNIGENLKYLAQFFNQKTDGVYCGHNVTVAPSVVFDTSKGSVILDDNVSVSDFCVLRGPLYVGPQTIVRSFCELKDGTSIGPVCKIGGEVEAAVVQGYANKQHYGFLGHAYVGEWVNLGAGTTNSDLKNTYGEIKMKGEKTGHQFLGCVIADYAKTAVGALIYTGKVIGFNSCVYGTAIADVPSFTNYARYGAKQITFPLELAQKTQIAMFSRRNVSPNKACQDLLKHIFSLTAAERNAAGVREGELNFIV